MGAVIILKSRLIPALLLDQGRCVKGAGFKAYRDVGHPVTAAKVYEAQGADELILLDIKAAREGRSILLETVQSTAEQCFMPLTVGGAIQTINDIEQLLRSGADKVSINTAAFDYPDLIEQGAKEFGDQCIVVSIDYKENKHGLKEVYVAGGTRSTGMNVIDWSKNISELGAGEILITSIDREGSMNGFDIETIKEVSDSVRCPVIAAGGAGTLQQLVDAIEKGHASAVAASSIFHFTDQSVVKCHSFMRQSGLDVRVT